MRLIDADKLLEKSWENEDVDGKRIYVVDIKDIEKAQTIEAVPLVHGEWIKKETDSETLAICNNCNHPISWWHKSNFCPSCGTDMKCK